MKLELAVTPLKHFPVLQGAQQLAWNYLLDRLFADAYHADIGTLHITLPSDNLRAEVELRASLTPARGSKTAHAFLSVSSQETAHANNLYILRYGRLSPFYSGASTRKMQHLLSVFTWQARAFGLPIRTFAKSPQLVDRAMFAMRQTFISEKNVPAYYHLYKTLTFDSSSSAPKRLP